MILNNLYYNFSETCQKGLGMNAALKKHLELLHNDTTAFITVAKRKDGNFGYHYHFKGVDNAYNGVLSVLDNEGDIYISNASYYAPKRGIATLFRINTLFADLDCHAEGEGFNVDTLMYYLDHEFFGVKVPHPSEIVFTGRGVQIFWLLEHAPRQALPLWTLVQTKILEELEEITEFMPNVEVDWACKDITRISRAPGTWNTKAKRSAEVIRVSQNRYRLDDVISGYFPSLDFDRDNYTKGKKKPVREPKNKVKQAVKSKDSNVIKIFNALTLLQARAEDFETLIKLRDGDCKGYRDHLLFYYIWTVIDKRSTLEDVERELHALNCLFKTPMSDSKITKKAKHVYNKFNAQSLKKAAPKQKYEWYDRYVFKNETVIKKLNITLDEQRQLKTIISKEIKNERDNDRKKKARRNENGLTKKQQEKADRYNTIQELKRLGYTQKAVSETLNISLPTVKRQWN